MKLSTRGRYGLRMLADLSNQGESLVTLASIAERQDVSANYLEQVAKDLKRAGIIRSVKGPKGGYSLALKPMDIIVGDLLRILEGDLRITDNNYGSESLLAECIRENVFEPLNGVIADFFDSITLEDVLNAKVHL